MRRKTKRLPSTALGSLNLQWRRWWDSNLRYIAAHLLEATSLLHARAADFARADRLKRSAARCAARQREAPALGSGGGGEAQGALRAACGAESAGGAELRREKEHEVLVLDTCLQRPMRTQAHAEAAGIAAAVEREVGMYGGGLCAMSECPGRSGERSECRRHGVLPHSRCIRQQTPVCLCRCRARTLPGDSTARHTIGRPNVVRPCRRAPPRTACRISLPELLLCHIAKAAEKIAAAVLACGRFSIKQAKRRSPRRREGRIDGGSLACEVRVDGRQTCAASADVELHFLLRGDRPEDAAREETDAWKSRIRRAFRACEAHAWRISSHNSRQLRRIVKPCLDGGGRTDGRAKAAVDTESGMRHAPAERADGTDILTRAARRLQISLDTPCRRQADLFQSDATFPEIFFSIITGCRGFFEDSCTHVPFLCYNF